MVEDSPCHRKIIVLEEENFIKNKYYIRIVSYKTGEKVDRINKQLSTGQNM